MKKQIKHLYIHQTSKVIATIYALLFFIFITIPAVIYNFYLGEIAMGVMTLILSPLIYWVSMYIVQAIGCWIYNLIAGHMGGIELDLADKISSETDPFLASSDKELL